MKVSASLLLFGLLLCPLALAQHPQVYGEESYRSETANIKDALQLIHVSDAEWSIFIVSPANWKSALPKSLQKEAAGTCYTYINLKVTRCNAEWLSHQGTAAIADALSHEYGHVLCYTREHSIACRDDERLADAYALLIRKH